MSKWGNRMTGVVLIGAGIGCFFLEKERGENKE